jgi:copper chaperone CopZ
VPQLVLELPSLYGDHHVTEVRRILFALDGVEDVYASSSFHTVEVTYDAAKIDPDAIQTVLAEAGYLDELPIPQEAGASAPVEERFFRHSASFRQVGKVSFTQEVSYFGRPLWPCPGMGPIKAQTLEEDNG